MVYHLPIPAVVRDDAVQRALFYWLGVTTIGFTLMLLLVETILAPGSLLAAYTASKSPTAGAVVPNENRLNDAHPRLAYAGDAQQASRKLEELKVQDQALRRRILDLVQAADAYFKDSAKDDLDFLQWQHARAYPGADTETIESFGRKLSSAPGSGVADSKAAVAIQAQSWAEQALRTIGEIDQQLDHIESLVRGSRREKAP